MRSMTRWALAGAIALAGVAAQAQAQRGEASDRGAVATARAETDMTQGEVRKIDRDRRKLMLKHDEIRNLEMPPMTMAFQVRDAAMLDGFKVGDKVRFRAAKVEGHYVVTAIEPSR